MSTPSTPTNPLQVEGDLKASRSLSQSSSNGGLDELETYVVQDGDTLGKIAAMHDTTPSKLAQINKMSGARYIFPGQVLRLPPKEPPRPPTPEPVLDNDVIDLANNFVRVNVRHLTEGRGIVDGTLLLTGELVMFDPYAHHPLVAESSVDKYQVIMPLGIVVNAVILKDFNRCSDDDPSLIYDKKEASNDEEAEAEKENGHSNNSSITAEKLMYLRIRMGQPIGSKIKRDETINSYGEATVKPDYWFILTLPRANFIYDFFHNVSKDFKMYGVLDVVDVERAGLELIREGRDAMEAEAGRTCNRATVAKLDKQRLSFASVDFSIIAPMVGESELMSKEERIYLSKTMPQKLECHTWIPVFSTSRDGFSLKNMMRKISSVACGSMLLVLSDLDKNVFGAFLSGVPTVGESFEGTGETFLFCLRPRIQAFNWTGENNFFYRVDNQCLIVGSSGGKFGLWIDRDLNKGRTQPCATFDNEPLTGGESEDFVVKTIECWAFEMA